MSRNRRATAFVLDTQLAFRMNVDNYTATEIAVAFVCYFGYQRWNKRHHGALMTHEQHKLLEHAVDDTDIIREVIEKMPKERILPVLREVLSSIVVHDDEDMQTISQLLMEGELDTALSKSVEPAVAEFALSVLAEAAPIIEKELAEEAAHAQKRDQERAADYMKVLKRMGYTVTPPLATKTEPAAKKTGKNTAGRRR